MAARKRSFDLSSGAFLSSARQDETPRRYDLPDRRNFVKQSEPLHPRRVTSLRRTRTPVEGRLRQHLGLLEEGRLRSLSGNRPVGYDYEYGSESSYGSRRRQSTAASERGSIRSVDEHRQYVLSRESANVEPVSVPITTVRYKLQNNGSMATIPWEGRDRLGDRNRDRSRERDPRDREHERERERERERDRQREREREREREKEAEATTRTRKTEALLEEMAATLRQHLAVQQEVSQLQMEQSRWLREMEVIKNGTDTHQHLSVGRSIQIVPARTPSPPVPAPPPRAPTPPPESTTHTILESLQQQQQQLLQQLQNLQELQQAQVAQLATQQRQLEDLKNQPQPRAAFPIDKDDESVASSVHLPVSSPLRSSAPLPPFVRPSTPSDSPNYLPRTRQASSVTSRNSVAEDVVVQVIMPRLVFEGDTLKPVVLVNGKPDQTPLKFSWFLSACDAQDSDPASLDYVPLHKYGKECEVLPSYVGNVLKVVVRGPRRSGSGYTGIIQLGLPRVTGIIVAGRPTEGYSLQLTSYLYTGGLEGKTQFRWYRDEELRFTNSRNYELTLTDVGCAITLQIEPYRMDGTPGPPATWKSDIIAPGTPRLAGIELRGKPCVGETLTVHFHGTYKGGRQGRSTLRWRRFAADGTSVPLIVQALSKRLDADDIGHYIFVECTPVRSDGARGKPVSFTTPVPISATPVPALEESTRTVSRPTVLPMTGVPSQQENPGRSSFREYNGPPSVQSFSTVDGGQPDEDRSLNPVACLELHSSGPDNRMVVGSEVRLGINSLADGIGRGQTEWFCIRDALHRTRIAEAVDSLILQPEHAGCIVECVFTPVSRDGSSGVPVSIKSAIVEPGIDEPAVTGVSLIREGARLVVVPVLPPGQTELANPLIEWFRDGKRLQSSINSYSHVIGAKDVGATIRVSYTSTTPAGVPTRTFTADHFVNESANASTGNGTPKLAAAQSFGEEVRIIDPCVGSRLRCEHPFSANAVGRRSGVTIQWYRSKDREHWEWWSTVFDDETPRAVYISADDLHAFVRCRVVLKGGPEEKLECESRVFLSPRHAQEVQRYLAVGRAAFEASTLAGEVVRLLMNWEEVRIVKVKGEVSRDNWKLPTLHSASWGPATWIELNKLEQHQVIVHLSGPKGPQAIRLTLEHHADAMELRTTAVLTFRTFYAMSSKAICTAVLGGAFHSNWKRGKPSPVDSLIKARRTHYADIQGVPKTELQADLQAGLPFWLAKQCLLAVLAG
eukprot:TRINITY_DN29363_c0_g1_i1.p1 TRINITY_DN29363_c0_g1~~TRINITY_DN29363_c0_g1_i1.p1  ORF type:complete len:1241 (-),score=152.99 TRINITY_DN29363_c0_g1_i1:24-3746(-)